MKILIVDDEADIREILAFNLKAAGYEVFEAGTAEAALVSVRQGRVPDLFLLDVMLPGMSGFKLAEIMRKNPLTAEIPIIFVTARDTEDDTVHGLGIGGDDYIAKPFSVREVVSRVGAVLRRASGRKPKDEEEKSLSFKTLKIDLVSKSVTVDVNITRLRKKTGRYGACIATRHGYGYYFDENAEIH